VQMTMNKYELALVINAKIEDDARTDAIEKIKALIEKFGGEITNVDEWGKKKLAYEIQKMSEAYYYFIHFDTDNTDCPNEIEDQIRIMENVIRYLCVKVEA
jgi:small subunit ribosomal protein S6